MCWQGSEAVPAAVAMATLAMSAVLLDAVVSTDADHVEKPVATVEIVPPIQEVVA